MIRTILVDDERLAIQGLELRLQAFDDVEIIERCANGREAIRAIKTLKPDLVFLDIQMPGFDGFSVVGGLAEVEPPLFVFVTAYMEHALKAFEAHAVDYLMKPVGPHPARRKARLRGARAIEGHPRPGCARFDAR
jgi:two-component system LytT family response regulator